MWEILDIPNLLSLCGKVEIFGNYNNKSEITKKF